MPTIKINVTLEDTALSDFARVVQRLKRAGLRVTQELRIAGVVSGEIDSRRLQRLRQVVGVKNVEQDRTDIGIPEPPA